LIFTLAASLTKLPFFIILQQDRTYKGSNFMSSRRYLDTAVELTNRIQRGLYIDKLPPIRQLVREFSSSMQTISKAVRVLQDNNIVSSARRGGTVINRENLPGGLIALCTYIEAGEEDKVINIFSDFRRMIAESGYVPILLSLPKNRKSLPLSVQKVFPADLAGAIFLYSSITQDYCQILDERNVPYVSMNLLPGCHQLNFVEKNSFDLIDQVIGELYSKGYRKIALIISSALENYDRICRREWKKIRAEYGLPPTGADLFLSNTNVWDGSVTHKAVNKILFLPEPPEVIISWGHNYGAGLQEYLRLKNTLVLCVVEPEDADYCKPGIVKLKITNDSVYHYRELWKVLQGLILEKGNQPVRRYINSLKFEFMDRLPTAEEFKTNRNCI
jgi:hypothetical protein